MTINHLKLSPSTKFRAGWLWMFVYLFICSPLRAEIEERWLLVFDTSAAMKKRLPAVESAVKAFMRTSAGGQMHADASLGVWTFCRELHAGQFPLTIWAPGQAVVTTSNLVNFLRHQWFAGDADLNAIKPTLDRVVAGSDRLTVLIFCDGYSQFDWTPYNSGINQTFRQNLEEREKARQPFVVLLRSQQGKFTGCTVSFPPGETSIPAFPAWPEPPKPVVSLPPPSPPPVVAAPALIIVGTNVGTNADDLKKLASQLPKPPAPAASSPSNLVTAVVTNIPVMAPPAVSNPPPVVPVVKKSPPTNNAVVKIAAPATNITNLAATAIQSPAQKPMNWRAILLTVGGVVILMVLLRVLFALVRSCRPRNSLITDSLNAPKVPPSKK